MKSQWVFYHCSSTENLRVLWNVGIFSSFYLKVVLDNPRGAKGAWTRSYGECSRPPWAEEWLTLFLKSTLGGEGRRGGKWAREGGRKGEGGRGRNRWGLGNRSGQRKEGWVTTRPVKSSWDGSRPVQFQLVETWSELLKAQWKAVQTTPDRFHLIQNGLDLGGGREPGNVDRATARW